MSQSDAEGGDIPNTETVQEAEDQTSLVQKLQEENQQLKQILIEKDKEILKEGQRNSANSLTEQMKFKVADLHVSIRRNRQYSLQGNQQDSENLPKIFKKDFQNMQQLNEQIKPNTLRKYSVNLDQQKRQFQSPQKINKDYKDQIPEKVRLVKPNNSQQNENNINNNKNKQQNKIKSHKERLQSHNSKNSMDYSSVLQPQKWRMQSDYKAQTNKHEYIRSSMEQISQKQELMTMKSDRKEGHNSVKQFFENDTNGKQAQFVSIPVSRLKLVDKQMIHSSHLYNI